MGRNLERVIDEDKREEMIFYHGHDALIKGVKSLWLELLWMSYLTEPALESIYLSLHITLTLSILLHNSLVSRQESMVLARASGRLRMMMWRCLLCHLRWRRESELRDARLGPH